MGRYDGAKLYIPLGFKTGCAGGRNQVLTRTGSVNRAKPLRPYQKDVPKM